MFESFKTNTARDICKALGLEISRCEVTGVRAGSIVIVFVIKPDPNSVTSLTPAAAAAEIAKQAADPTVSLHWVFAFKHFVLASIFRNRNVCLYCLL